LDKIYLYGKLLSLFGDAAVASNTKSLKTPEQILKPSGNLVGTQIGNNTLIRTVSKKMRPKL
jgi:hypothetical protein